MWSVLAVGVAFRMPQGQRPRRYMRLRFVGSVPFEPKLSMLVQEADKDAAFHDRSIIVEQIDKSRCDSPIVSQVQRAFGRWPRWAHRALRCRSLGANPTAVASEMVKLDKVQRAWCDSDASSCLFCLGPNGCEAPTYRKAEQEPALSAIRSSALGKVLFLVHGA